MVFSSPIFLFGFLPVVLLCYYLSPKPVKNFTLLAFSLLFYAWGEVFYLGVMLTSIVANYITGLLIYKSFLKDPDQKRLSKIYLTIGVIINLVLLVSFKYANFLVDNVNVLFALIHLPALKLKQIHLPLGISFFTFQAISYIVDVYRKEVPAQKNIFNLALYISLFPQLIAGPIVRYHDVSLQIATRRHSMALVSSGVIRFVYGLAKKMLIANPLGETADSVFDLASTDLTMPLAWIGIMAYSLQIYFDFSGYSDMAIGLGRMFGFEFLENFNYPYISRSVREFWRRWHISLSTWFRDYVYIPAGGSRVSTIRVYLNLLMVFILTGIWHGASWNFIVWGLFHGVFLASEHAGFSEILKKAWLPLQHFYLLGIVLTGWVFFRVENLSQAVDFLLAMSGFSGIATSYMQFMQVLSQETLYAFILGIGFSVPVAAVVRTKLNQLVQGSLIKSACVIVFPRLAVLSVLLLLSVLKIASSTYNPFIYFRF